MKSDKHVFALYAGDLAQEEIPNLGDTFSYKDEETWSRITKVLRLNSDDHVIIFNDSCNITITLTQACFVKKNHVIGTIVQSSVNKKLSPEIVLFQGITKKPALENIYYAAAQLGISRIIPIKTAKIQRAWEGQREHERLRKIMIAACEQSKQFVIPHSEDPITLSQLCAMKHDTALLFEHGGMSILEGITKNQRIISCFIGPEGGITQEERTLLEHNNFIAVRLTPTILRAQDAVIVGLGTLRSLIGS